MDVKANVDIVTEKLSQLKSIKVALEVKADEIALTVEVQVSTEEQQKKQKMLEDKIAMLEAKISQLEALLSTGVTPNQLCGTRPSASGPLEDPITAFINAHPQINYELYTVPGQPIGSQAGQLQINIVTQGQFMFTGQLERRGVGVALVGTVAADLTMNNSSMATFDLGSFGQQQATMKQSLSGLQVSAPLEDKLGVMPNKLGMNINPIDFQVTASVAFNFQFDMSMMNPAQLEEFSTQMSTIGASVQPGIVSYDMGSMDYAKITIPRISAGLYTTEQSFVDLSSSGPFSVTLNPAVGDKLSQLFPAITRAANAAINLPAEATNVNVGVQTGGGNSNVNVGVQTGGGNSNVNVGVQTGGGDSNVNVGVQTGGGDTNVGVGVQTDGGDTNVGVGVQTDGGDTNVGVGVQTGGGDTNVGVGVQTGGGDTNVGVGVQADGGNVDVGVGVQTGGGELPPVEQPPIKQPIKKFVDQPAGAPPSGDFTLQQQETHQEVYDFGVENVRKTVKFSLTATSHGTWDTGGKLKDYFVVTTNGQQVINDSSFRNSARKPFTFEAQVNERGQVIVGFYVNTTGADETITISDLNSELIGGVENAAMPTPDTQIGVGVQTDDAQLGVGFQQDGENTELEVGLQTDDTQLGVGFQTDGNQSQLEAGLQTDNSQVGVNIQAEGNAQVGVNIQTDDAQLGVGLQQDGENTQMEVGLQTDDTQMGVGLQTDGVNTDLGVGLQTDNTQAEIGIQTGVGELPPVEPTPIEPTPIEPVLAKPEPVAMSGGEFECFLDIAPGGEVQAKFVSKNAGYLQQLTIHDGQKLHKMKEKGNISVTNNTGAPSQFKLQLLHSSNGGKNYNPSKVRRTQQGPDTWLLEAEDIVGAGSDNDYNDYVVEVTVIQPAMPVLEAEPAMPEPNTGVNVGVDVQSDGGNVDVGVGVQSDGGNVNVGVGVQAGGLPPMKEAPMPLGNQPPVIEFASPTDGQSFTSASEIPVVINATDPDGKVRNIQLFVDGQFVRQENHFPYEWGMANSNARKRKFEDLNIFERLTPGSHTFEAVATDNAGAETRQSVSFSIGQAVPEMGGGVNVGVGVQSDGGNVNVGVGVNVGGGYDPYAAGSGYDMNPAVDPYATGGGEYGAPNQFDMNMDMNASAGGGNVDMGMGLDVNMGGGYDAYGADPYAAGSGYDMNPAVDPYATGGGEYGAPNQFDMNMDMNASAGGGNVDMGMGLDMNMGGGEYGAPDQFDMNMDMNASAGGGNVDMGMGLDVNMGGGNGQPQPGRGRKGKGRKGKGRKGMGRGRKGRGRGQQQQGMWGQPQPQQQSMFSQGKGMSMNMFSNSPGSAMKSFSFGPGFPFNFGGGMSMFGW